MQRSIRQQEIRLQMNGMEEDVAVLLGIEDRKIASTQASTLTGRHPTSRIDIAEFQGRRGNERAYHYGGGQN
jgi:hypothetical protein